MESGKQDRLPDLFGIWKEFMGKQQDVMEQMMHQVMKTEEFAQILDQHVEIALTRKQILNQVFEQILKDIPIATQGDLTRLAGQVVSLDAKVDRLEIYFEETLEPMVKGVRDQLTRLENQINLLADRIGQAAPLPAPAPAPARRGKTTGSGGRAAGQKGQA